MDRIYYKNVINNIIISKYPTVNIVKLIKVKSLRLSVKTKNYSIIHFWYLLLLFGKKPYYTRSRITKNLDINLIRNQVQVCFVKFLKNNFWHIYPTISFYILPNDSEKHIKIIGNNIDLYFSNASYSQNMILLKKLYAQYSYSIRILISFELSNSNFFSKRFMAIILLLLRKPKIDDV